MSGPQAQSEIPCPKCGRLASSVADSRGAPDGMIRRRRYCAYRRCQHRFTTYELLSERLAELKRGNGKPTGKRFYIQVFEED